MSAAQPYLYYIHGFNSSSQSHKARVLKRYLERTGGVERYRVPDLPHDFGAAIELLQQSIEKDLEQAPVALIGSSLGGYYGTYLSERYGIKAVLINPAVDAYKLLSGYIGDNQNLHTGETYTLTEHHLEQLKAMHVEHLSHPENVYVMVQTGDDTLDYRLAVEQFQGCKMLVEKGGSHGFDGFENHIDEMLAFLNFSS